MSPSTRTPTRDRRLAYAPLETALGRLLVGYRGETVLRSSLTQTPAEFASDLGEEYGQPPEARPSLPDRLREPVRTAAEGGFCAVDIDLDPLTPFQQRVLRAAIAIPRGHTCSYGELAERIGAPGAARAVGSALGRNPVPLLIPCHRVVRSGGDVGKYGMGGAQMKVRLLRREGALSRGGRVVA